jgi:hypothetical protein
MQPWPGVAFCQKVAEILGAVIGLSSRRPEKEEHVPDRRSASGGGECRNSKRDTVRVLKQLDAQSGAGTV